MKPYLWLIKLIGVIVPRRLRNDWRWEWEAELHNLEETLAAWERLGLRGKLDLLWRSTSAFWDAMCLLPKRWEDEMIQDLRFGVRMLFKHKGFTAVVVFTLALGIGANSAMFSVVDALMLRPLPYPNPERMVWIEEASKKNNERQDAWGGHFLAWRERAQTLEGVAAYDTAKRTLIGAGEAELIDCALVSSGFLPLLGAHSLRLGRNFAPAEDAPGGDRVAILSFRLWNRRFNGDRNIVGKSITLSDKVYTVIGVTPEDFRFIYPFDALTPLALDPQQQLAGEIRYYGSTFARFKAGSTREQAEAELDAIAQQYESTRPEGGSRIESRTRLAPLQQYFLGGKQRPLKILLGAVGLILLIACANVANLLLSRAVTRKKELAIRAALGAGRLRLMRQMLIECLLLAGIGGAAGLLLAYWLTHFLNSLNTAESIGMMSRVTMIRIDWSVLGFTMFLSVLTGLLFGLLPSLQHSRPDLNDSLKEGGRAGESQGRRLRGMLLVGEVAIALVLLVGAGLLIRSFVKLLDVNPGYNPQNMLTARIPIPSQYREKSQRIQFYDRLFERVAALPGVTGLGATSQLPLTGYNMGGGLRVEGRTLAPGEKLPGAPITAVNSDYFRVMNMTLRAGRRFNEGDGENAPSVAILSETLARTLFSNESPIGKRIVVPGRGPGEEWTTIVGVVNDVRYRGLDGENEPAVYLHYRQLARPSMSLAIRSSLDPASLAPALRAAIKEVDSSSPVYDVMLMSDRLSRSVSSRRFNLTLMSGFAALALLLAGVGVYGVISYAVTERTHEVGVRMALGARTPDVLRLVIRQGMQPVFLGVALGLLGAYGLTRLLTSLLFNVTAYDPLTFVGVAVILSLIALLACYLPARRAARIDPMIALRQE